MYSLVVGGDEGEQLAQRCIVGCGQAQQLVIAKVLHSCQRPDGWSKKRENLSDNEWVKIRVHSKEGGQNS
jgi:hypothetical protein